MAPKQTIEVLAAYKPLTRILKLYNSENFHDPDKSIVRRNIRETEAFSIGLVSTLIVLISAISVFREIKLDLVRLAHPLSIWLCVAQIFLSYVVLVAEERQLSGTIAQLQDTINLRKWTTYIILIVFLFLAIYYLCLLYMTLILKYKLFHVEDLVSTYIECS